MPKIKSKSWFVTNKRRRQLLLNQICEELMYIESTSPNGKMPWRTVTNIVNQTKDDNPWVTRNMITFAYKKFTNNVKKKLDEDEASKPTFSMNSGGRKKGDTNLKKFHKKEVIAAAKNEITQLYKDEKHRYNEMVQIFPAGWLKKTIISICNKRGIAEEAASISLSTIRNRKNTIIRQGGGSESLMREIEPHLVELICAMAHIRRCLTTTESLALANDLISGTPIEEKIIHWKKKENGI